MAESLAEKRTSKGSKGNEQNEGIDDSNQKGGGGEREHKKSRIGGAAHFVHKRVTGQPKSTPKKKGKSGPSNPPHFDMPASSSANIESKESQQPQGLTWNPTLWQKTPPSVAQPTDPVQPIASASGAVIPSIEETESDDIVLSTSEGATPPIPMKHDCDDDDADTANLSSFVLVPQQSSDDPELSLKLARIELENGRHKRELKDKEKQIKEYEEEIIKLRTQIRTQMSYRNEFEARLSEKDQLQKNYNADMERLMVVIKKQHNIESTLRSELKELQDTVTKIEADKRLELEELTKKLYELKEELDKIGEKLDEQEKVIDKQKQDIETLQAININLTEAVMNKESELQDTRDQLQEVKDKLAKNIEEKDEVIASLQQAVEGRSETVSQMKQALDQQMMRANELLEAKQKQVDELVEKLQMEEAQSAIYKQDFETERNDRKKLHQSFTDLQAHCEYLKQKLTKEEEKFTTVQRQHHELQQQYANDKEQLINDHYKLIASMTDEVEKTKGELMKAKEQLSGLTKEKKRLEKRIKELDQGETERVIEIEQEMQVLTAQVNAYSREVEKQKRLVTQSQEKHKTEVIQLQEKLNREMKSKDSELFRMRQQLTNVSANNEQLLTAHHEERTRLEGQIERMRQANKVLMEKVKAYRATDSPWFSPSIREPQYPLSPSIAVRPSFAPTPVPEPVVQSNGDGVLVLKTEGVTSVHHTDSDSISIDIPPLMSKEEMARMFKPYNHQGSSDWNQSPQQVEDSSLAAQKMQSAEESLVAEQRRQELARKADDALLEVDRMRKQADLKQKSEHQQTNIDSDTQDESRPKGQLTKEIEEMAEIVRKESRGPSTEEVLFNDDPNDDRPYDPNLVCPRCGKQYRKGEIQKLRRHMNEFCTGIR